MVEFNHQLVSRIYKLTQTKTEFDIIPHVDTENHEELLEIEETFGLCSCLAGERLWYPIYRSVFSQEGSLSVEHLTILLLFVPSCATFWHRRKELVQLDRLSLKEELAFTRLVLIRFPRATEPLQHRHWVLEKLSSSELEGVVGEEIDLCERLCDKHRCNYMVWQHRRWLLLRQGASIENVQSELKRMDDWNRSHPVDVSGWCFRAHLFRMWLSSSDEEKNPDSLKLSLFKESERIQSAILKTPENDALWSYRRQVFDIYRDLGSSFVDLCRFDPIASAIPPDPCLCNLSDTELRATGLFAVPSEFSQPWSRMLYMRHLRWLAQTASPSIPTQ
ncbi:unnamed protein product [Mesocestoides corti]|uniref:Protein geranylgeranyltransferase type II n=1 Tax=Mesocestoides corti TaxID=53468 RepID=A0A0R3U9I1_MESCO|nr:unnamed protein product [Mesocestoides corti]